ncbi:MAG TPA: hypothetical protein VFN95_06935 [Flavitalea sp.]|nr:hypothetical protein [Flavitalea sp.]
MRDISIWIRHFKKGSVISVLLVVMGSCRDSSRIERIRELKEYSSGSGMAFFNNRIYLIGDDMGYLLVTDTSFRMIDSIRLYHETGRIPKNIKPDLEAASIIRAKKAPFLLLLGSGSVFPYRSKGWLLDIKTREKMLINLDTFYKRLRANGINDVNIEGLTSIPGGVLLANRGNKSNPKNYLIFTASDFWKNQEATSIKVMKLGANTDTTSFSGASGLDYSHKSDRLFLTVSTENTYSSFADGTIGKSYLWIIDNLSSKRRLAAINPNRVIDLESLDERFKGHKIESVCILSESRTAYRLAMVADDDKGTSVLFTIKLNKKN